MGLSTPAVSNRVPCRSVQLSRDGTGRGARTLNHRVWNPALCHLSFPRTRSCDAIPRVGRGLPVPPRNGTIRVRIGGPPHDHVARRWCAWRESNPHCLWPPAPQAGESTVPPQAQDGVHGESRTRTALAGLRGLNAAGLPFPYVDVGGGERGSRTPGPRRAAGFPGRCGASRRPPSLQ